MSSTNIVKVLLLLFVAFALGELVFTIQRYGLPNFFKSTPGSCKILEEKFCKTARLIHWKNIQGKNVIYIGFKLPSQTPIFAPIDGELIKAQLNDSSPLKGFYVNIMDTKNTTTSFNFIGDLLLPNMNTLSLAKGEIIGTIGDKGMSNLGGYNLIVGLFKNNVFEENLAKTLFPKLKE